MYNTNNPKHSFLINCSHSIGEPRTPGSEFAGTRCRKNEQELLVEEKSKQELLHRSSLSSHSNSKLQHNHDVAAPEGESPEDKHGNRKKRVGGLVGVFDDESNYGDGCLSVEQREWRGVIGVAGDTSGGGGCTHSNEMVAVTLDGGCCRLSSENEWEGDGEFVMCTQERRRKGRLSEGDEKGAAAAPLATLSYTLVTLTNHTPRPYDSAAIFSNRRKQLLVGKPNRKSRKMRRMAAAVFDAPTQTLTVKHTNEHTRRRK